MHNFTNLHASVVPTSEIRTTGVIDIFICQQLTLRLALASIGLISISVVKNLLFRHTRRTDTHERNTARAYFILKLIRYVKEE